MNVQLSIGFEKIKKYFKEKAPMASESRAIGAWGRSEFEVPFGVIVADIHHDLGEGLHVGGV